MSNVKKFPNEFDDLDFEIIEEHWNEYELEDNSRIKARLVLTKIVTDPHNNEFLGFDFAPAIFSVYTPLSHRGEMQNAPPPQEYNILPKYEVRVSRADEKYNRYKILRNGKIVKIKLEIPEINRITNRFDNNGIPFYLMSYAPNIIINDPKTKIQP